MHGDLVTPLKQRLHGKFAIERQCGPTALIFSRQNLMHQHRDESQIANIEKGGYVLVESVGTPDAILIATGSEVSLAVEAHAALTAMGKNIRVVSMPSSTVFDRQDSEYRESVLPLAVRTRVAVEAGHKDFWYKYVGFDGKVIGMSTFGESAPAADLYRYFGITSQAVIDAVSGLLK